MSDISCTACADLREDAPEFMLNGVTAAVCTALQNNKGFNASNGNNNAVDLQNGVDCLIGALIDALETYDVCDWQEFMAKFLRNNYELLKALVCNEKGQWSEIDTINAFLDQICPSIDNIFKLIRGNNPPHHDGYFLQDFIDMIDGNYNPNDGAHDHDVAPTVDNFKPSFRADISEGAGCDASKKLGRYTVSWHHLIDFEPYVWGWGPNQTIPMDTVMGVIPWSAVGSSVMSLDRWKRMLRTAQIYQWGLHGDSSGGGHLLCVRASGYVIIDGVTFNPSFATYGENNMVLRWGPVIGGNFTGGINGSLVSPIKSYDA